MNRIEWDLMGPDAIEIRPAQVKDGKVTLLCYQNGRNTMDALDKQFGEFGWKVEYKDVAGQIYGRLSIKDPDTGEWIYKEDTGEESNISASKGQSTDILKRLAVRFGYGRELYSVPKIVIPDDGYGNHLKVSEVSWNDNRECTHITLVNKFGKVMYTWSKDATVKEAPKDGEVKQQVNQVKQDEDWTRYVVEQVKQDDDKSNCELLKEFCSNKKQEEGIDKGELLRFYQFYSERCCKWPNRVRPDILWEKWQQTKYN